MNYFKEPSSLSDPLVSVIVVNWNGRAYVGDCLDSLKNQTLKEIEVIVIDNGSTDGSLDWIQANYPGFVRILTNTENLGFGKANNQGIKIAQGKYIAFLNNDAKADPFWLEELVKTAEEDQKAGMLASKVYLQGEPKHIDTVGHLIYRDGLNRGRGRLEKDYGQYDQKEEVLFPSGCAALYRREMLKEIGLMDEDFFAYGDDTDIGLHGRLFGWKCLYVPQAIAYHRYSQSSGSYSPLKAFYVERNRVWIAVKYFPLSQLLKSPFYTFIRFLFQGYGAFVGRGAAGKFRREFSSLRLLMILIKAYGSALKGMPKMWRKRQEIRKQIVISKEEIGSWFIKFGITARELSLKE